KTLCTSDIDFSRWLDVTTQMKSEVEQSASGNRSLTQDEFNASKRYFARLNSFALYIAKDAGTRSALNSALQGQGAARVCESAFVSKSDWNELNKKCLKNGFYVCAEEVRAYPDSIGAIEVQLTDTSKNRLRE